MISRAEAITRLSSFRERTKLEWIANDATLGAYISLLQAQEADSIKITDETFVRLLQQAGMK